MSIVHHDTNQGAQQVAPRPTLVSGGSTSGNFAMRRDHFVQVGRGIAGAFKARGVVQ